MKYTTGFVVGKFSPLHRGHQFLIGRALAECQRVVIVSYSVPEFQDNPASVRRSWLNLFYGGRAEILVFGPGQIKLGDTWTDVPDNNASEFVHRFFCARVIEHTRACPPDVVFTSEEYGDGFSDFLSMYFSKQVDHVCVDVARKNYPVSGTQLRSKDMTALNYYLSPAVKNPPVKRLVLYGGESSGKTTLAEYLSNELGVPWVHEEGRYYTERKGGIDQLSIEDMLIIGREQVALEIATVEKAAQQGHSLVICDTGPLTTYFYSLELFNESPDQLTWLAERDYDVTVLCRPDFPFVQDGTRMDDAFRMKGYQWYIMQLRMRNISFTEAAGTLSQRMSTVVDWIAKH